MRLFVMPNGFTEQQVDQAVECIRALESGSGHDCALSRGNSLRLFGDDRAARFSPEQSDLIVSLGGDGSVLRAAQIAIQADRPLLGVNSGRLGYLCAMDYAQIEKFNTCLERCVISERTLLYFEHQAQAYYALNDVIVGKQNFGATADLIVTPGQHVPFRLRGDGLIIATPTGSTAYSLSAGGPMVDSRVPALLLTPICAHDAGAHPMVLGDDSTVSVRVRHGSAGLFADGRCIGDLTEQLSVRRADRTLSIYMRTEGDDRVECENVAGRGI